MATVKLTDKPVVEAVGSEDHIVIETGGKLRRLPVSQVDPAAKPVVEAVESDDHVVIESGGQVKRVPAAKFLPSGPTVSGDIHVCDVGSGQLDISTLDFSQYAAGSLILVVGDMGV